jgi:hypothetical protein
MIDGTEIEPSGHQAGRMEANNGGFKVRQVTDETFSKNISYKLFCNFDRA